MRHLGGALRPRWPELAGVAAVLTVVLLIGLFSPPNNWESMAYRMMRVAMWMQQGSVAHYATGYIEQLFHTPLVSYHILQLQILAAGDRFANVPEWLSLAGCAIAASLIARELRQPFSVQVVAAVLAATVPMGLLMGSSTQGNVLAAYWLLGFVLLFVQYASGPTLWRLACCGCAAGFALLAKATAYVFLLPVGLALGIYGVWRLGGLRRGVGAMAAAATVAVVLNLGFYGRNWQTFDHPLAPAGARTHMNARLGVDVLAANLLRNSMLHWGMPSAKFNQALVEGVAEVLDGIPDLPEATVGLHLAEVGVRAQINEVRGPNFLHYWLLALTALGLLWLGTRARLGCAVAATSCLLAAWLMGVLAFSGLLAWEQWNTRYDLALFMLGCPLAAAFLGRLAHPGGRERSLRAASGLFLAASVPFLLFKESAPLLKLRGDYDLLPAERIFDATRTRAYFNHLGGQEPYETYVELADRIAAMQPAEVGLHAGQWQYAYPFHVLLKERLPNVQVAYYDVGGASGTLEREDHAPEVVVAVRRNVAGIRGIGSLYRSVWTHPSGVTLLRRTDGTNPDASRPATAGQDA